MLGDQNLPKMVGDRELVEIDECLLRGHHRKDGRGRITVGEEEEAEEKMRKRLRPGIIRVIRY
jgi:hypothetical protein